MSLDISLEQVMVTEVFRANITHNLGNMAVALGIYECLWHPDGTLGMELINPLETAIKKMRDDPDFYRHYDASNGWGTYNDFVPWLEKLLKACKEYPHATVRASI